MHTNSGRKRDGVTLCRCVYEHARATTKEAARSGRDAEERDSTPHAKRFCASSSSAPHKAHICVIVPAGSIRPMLARRTRSYPTVPLKSTRAMPRIFSESPRIHFHVSRCLILNRVTSNSHNTDETYHPKCRTDEILGSEITCLVSTKGLTRTVNLLPDDPLSAAYLPSVKSFHYLRER